MTPTCVYQTWPVIYTLPVVTLLVPVYMHISVPSPNLIYDPLGFEPRSIMPVPTLSSSSVVIRAEYCEYSTKQNAYNSGDHVTEVQMREVSDIVCSVHVIPSGDVADIVELLATAQNSPSSGDHVTHIQ